MTRQLRLLIVDDDLANLTTVKAVVGEAFPGSRIITAPNGPQGIEMALAEDPDVILLDVVMPGMDGCEVCRRLKADERLRHIPVVFVTVLETDGQIRVKALEAGAEAFLSKPIDAAELTAQIRAMAKIKAANVTQRTERKRLAELVAIRTAQIAQELAERKLAERRQSLLAEILGILNEHSRLADAISLILAAIQRETGFDAVGIRLQNGDDYPYLVQTGFSDDFMLVENTLIACDGDGGVCSDEKGGSLLECTCGMVVSGQTDPANFPFTPGGSFWTNDTRPLLELPADKDPRFHPRNRCIHAGFLSMALIPIRAKGEIVGLLQLNDRKKDRLTPAMVQFFEETSASIGVALAQKQATEALRESKEQFQAMFDTASIGIAQADPQTGKWLRVNQKLCEITGYTAEELLALRVPEITHPEDRRQDWEAFQRVVRGEAPDYQLEKRYIRKDGTVVWVNVNVTVIRNGTGQPVRTMAAIEDISARKRAEEEVQLLKRSIDLHHDGAYWRDPEGRFVYVNDAGGRTLGYEPGELIGKMLTDVNPAATPERMKAVWEQIRKDGVHRAESVLRRRDGSEFPVEITASYIQFGGKEYSFGFVRDITERKRAEEDYRTLFREMLDGWAVHEILCDGQGNPVDYRFLAVNPAFERMTGLKAEDILGRTVLEVLPGTEQYWIETYGKVALTGKPVLFENYSAGIEKHFEVKAFRPAPNQFACVFTDITERKRAEDALRQSEEMLREAQGIAGLGSYVLDLSTRSWRSSAELERILGIDEGYERSMEGWAALFHPDDRAMMTDYFRNDVLGRGQNFDKEYRILRRNDGAVRWVHALGRLEFDTSGRPLKMYGTVQDITERRLAGEERAKLEAQLHQAQKMESVGRLAGGVAHDFNNMLAVILGHVELALNLVDPAQPLHADLEEVHKAAHRSADLTRQLLAFARRQTVVPRVLDLDETVAGTLKMLQRLIGEDIHLEWHPSANPLTVKVDPSQIDQILANLCVNARDAIADVGRITIETAGRTFDEEYCGSHAGAAPGEYAMLAVSDDGCGMDKETLNSIFEPFFTTKGVGEGTGLGLATVYGAVRQNNGFINVYSEPGRGTTFAIYLPRHADEGANSRARDAFEPVPHGNEIILLAEDESSVLKLTTKLLQELGYTVLAARTPGDALRTAQEYPGEIHLLVTDVVMPEMNGRDLAGRLSLIRPKIKHLFMSGYTANVIAQHGVLENGVHFIQKPFSSTDLAVEVRKTLDGE